MPPMGRSRPLISILLLLLLSLSISDVLSDAMVGNEPLESECRGVVSSPKIELEQLKSKISSLESIISKNAQELKNKDDAIAHMKEIVKEKSESILVLQKEVEEVEKKGAVDAAELVQKAHARQEKKIEKLKGDLQLQGQRKDGLEARASAAEIKAQDLKLKLQNLQKTNEEQKQRMKKTSNALKVAEESLLRAKKETTSVKKELRSIYQAWLPPWIENHVGDFQEHAVTKWKSHGRPAFDTFVQKASQTVSCLKKHAEPHLKAVKTKLVPVLEEKWTALWLFAKPHVEHAPSKVAEIYQTSKTTFEQHFRRVQDATHPYIHQAKTISKPYIDQAGTIARPHVEKFRITLKPYTEKIVRHCAKFLKSARARHLQLQDFVRENLRKHELTRALAKEERVRFLTSVLLGFAAYYLYEAFSYYIFSKIPRKSTRSSRSSGSRQKNKCRQGEK